MTVFYGVKILQPTQINELKEHLLNNNYRFSLCDDLLFIHEDELSYLISILQEHEISFEYL